MVRQTEAVIFLNDQRDCSQADWFRSYQTYNAGSHFHDLKSNHENLEVINDLTLKGGCTLKRRLTKNTLILLVPVIGELHYRNSRTEGALDVGQSFLFAVDSGDAFEISNLYQNELINFLEIRISVGSSIGNKTLLSSFDLETNKGSLIPLVIPDEKTVDSKTPAVIGKFYGRQEGAYHPTNFENEVFAFVIEGVFEVQHRLLHARDGLALFHLDKIEFEALSKEAIIVFLEFGF
jgi:hypothetical protein